MAPTRVNLLKPLCKEKDGNIDVDFTDVVIRGVTVIRDGDIPARAANSVSAQPQVAPKAAPAPKEPEKSPLHRRKYALMALAIILLAGFRADVAPKRVPRPFYRVCARLRGWLLRGTCVSCAITPLMSVTNAISGIIAVGHYCKLSGRLTLPRRGAYRQH